MSAYTKNRPDLLADSRASLGFRLKTSLLAPLALLRTGVTRYRFIRRSRIGAVLGLSSPALAGRSDYQELRTPAL